MVSVTGKSLHRPVPNRNRMAAETIGGHVGIEMVVKACEKP